MTVFFFFQVIYLIKLKGEIRIHINTCILYKKYIKQCRGTCCYGMMTFYCKNQINGTIHLGDVSTIDYELQYLLILLCHL